MIMITPLPGVTATKPGSATFPFPGIGVDVVDGDGNSVPLGGGGYLVLTRPWPAMLRGIYGDPERYKQTYWSRFPGKYFAGDGAKRDARGLPVAARPGRRRDERLRPPDQHHRGGVRARRRPARRRGRGRRQERPGHGPGDLRVRDPEGRRRGERRARPPSCASTSRRSSARSRSRSSSCSRRTCRRPVPARSCGACCATSPRVAPWAIPPRSPTPRSWRPSGPTAAPRRNDVPFDFLKRKKIVPDPAPVVPVTMPPPGTRPSSGDGDSAAGVAGATSAGEPAALTTAPPIPSGSGRGVPFDALTEEWRLVGPDARRRPALRHAEPARADRHHRGPVGADRRIRGVQRGARTQGHRSRTT